MTTPVAFSHIKCLDHYMPGSLLLDGTYYLMESDIENEEIFELGAALHKLTNSLGKGFYITYSKLREIFPSRGDANKFIFLMLQQVDGETPRFKLSTEIDGDDLALYVNTDITETLAQLGYPMITPLVDSVVSDSQSLDITIIPVSPPLETVVQISKFANFSVLAGNVSHPTATEFTFTSLSSATPYYIRIKYVIPDYGDSDWVYEYKLTTN